MIYKEYVYRLRLDEFYEFLVDYRKGVRVLEERDGIVEFAVYEPLEGLSPTGVREVRAIPPKESFKPIQVGDFVILPPWIKPLVINPGSAFGTGLHPTTQLCLEAIEDFFQEGWSAIDVGCGSGILSIALKLMGAKEVVAIDKDENAVLECKRNAELNGFEIKVYHAEPKDIALSFDFLVANLETQIFLEVMDDLVRLFRKVAVFSGIYKRRELRTFLNLVKNYDLGVKRVRSKKDWFCVVLEK